MESLHCATEGHGLYTDPHRRQYYTRLLAFLAKSLEGTTATAGTGSAGEKAA